MATSIRMNPDIEQRLDALAARTGRTKAFYLREIIERGLEDMEDYYLAADVLERVRKGEEPVYTLEAVERELVWWTTSTGSARKQVPVTSPAAGPARRKTS